MFQKFILAENNEHPFFALWLEFPEKMVFYQQKNFDDLSEQNNIHLKSFEKGHIVVSPK
jgi:hypothetical protein